MSFSLLGIFGAGILTFVTPCVLPLMPIYLASLVGGDIRQISGMARGVLMLRALLFSVGFISVFTLMGLTASTLGSFLVDHKFALTLGAVILILLFGLKFVGAIQIPIFDRIVRADDTKMQTRFGGINALVMGVVFAAGWSPCVGPVLGSVLTYTASATSNPATGGLYLAIYGLGFALPLLATAAFAEAGVRVLKSLNPYLPKIERAIGGLMLVIAASLFMDLSGQAATVSADISPESATTIQTPSPRDLTASDHWPAMVELYSEDCAICQRMKPIVAGIESQCHGNRVNVRTIDVSKPANRTLAKSYRLVGVPTFIFLDKENQEVARLVGEQTESALYQALSALRGEPCPGVGQIDSEPGSLTPINLDFPEQEDAENVPTCGAAAQEDTVHAKGAAACDSPPTM